MYGTSYPWTNKSIQTGFCLLHFSKFRVLHVMSHFPANLTRFWHPNLCKFNQTSIRKRHRIRCSFRNQYSFYVCCFLINFGPMLVPKSVCFGKDIVLGRFPPWTCLWSSLGLTRGPFLDYFCCPNVFWNDFRFGTWPDLGCAWARLSRGSCQSYKTARFFQIP